MGHLLKNSNGHLIFSKGVTNHLVKEVEFLYWRKYAWSNVSWADALSKMDAQPYWQTTNSIYNAGPWPYSWNSYGSFRPQKWWIASTCSRWNTSSLSGDTYTDVQFYLWLNPFFGSLPHDFSVILEPSASSIPPSNSLAVINAYPSRVTVNNVTSGWRDVTLDVPVTCNQFMYIHIMEHPNYTGAPPNNKIYNGHVRTDFGVTLHN